MPSFLSKASALQFVILMGLISLFADITYEGARSITGQYLAILGASGTVVGIVAGFGEFAGYGLRVLSGYISDRTGRYWLITGIGYTINLLAVPLLALAGNWPLAAGLIVLERLGKAIRTPARDAMLSYATQTMGRGWGFGLHQAMDRIGAIIGPLIITAILAYQGSYQEGFAWLLIPALCALSLLACARFLYPRPQDLEIKHPHLEAKGLTRSYWIYIAAVSCVAAGYVDFSLIAYHFQKKGSLPEVWVPLFFAIAMAADGLSALICGRLYDKKGLPVLMGVTALSAFFVPLVFLSGFTGVLIGIILWGIGLGAQESVMRAVVGNLVQGDKRATAYGFMHFWFGLSWFVGSALMGALIDHALPYLIAFSMAIQLLAIPLFYYAIEERKR